MFLTKKWRLTKHKFYVKELSPENRAVYEIVWKIMIEPDRSYTTQYDAESMLCECQTTNEKNGGTFSGNM
jgi:hypothetical protein